MTVGPVCNVPVDQPTAQPTTPLVPAIPQSDGTMAGMQNTMQALTQAVRLLTGQNPDQNNSYQQQNPQGGNNPSKNPGRFVEVARSTATVRITQPGNPQNYVDVLRINSLTMRDTVTGEQWVWTR